MARYSAEHKEATRRRMVESAGRRFKSDGFDGSGISTLVADVGLTNGAFYGQFDSKDDLIVSVVEEQLAQQVARVAEMPRGLESVDAFLLQYLSREHRDDLAEGCPSAALLDEIARSSEAAREAYTDGARNMIEAISRHLDSGDGQDATAGAIGLYTLLIGSLQLARAVTDPDLSDRILAAAYANAMTLAGVTPPTSHQA